MYKLFIKLFQLNKMIMPDDVFGEMIRPKLAINAGGCI